MSKVAKNVVGAVVIIVVAVTPLISGLFVESKFNSGVKDIQESLQLYPDIKLSSSFNRGWISSTARTVLKVGPGSIVVSHNITHNPLINRELGKIESRLEFLGEEKKVAEKLFAGKDPLLVTTHIAFSGDKSVNVFSPAIEKQVLTEGSDSSIAWGGLSGSYSTSGDSVVSDMKAPLFSFSSPEGAVNISNITMTGKNIYIKDWNTAANKNWDGSGEINIGKISVASPMGAGSLSMNLSTVATDKSNNNFDYAMALKFTDIDLPPVMDVASGKHDKIELGFMLRGLPKKPLAVLLAKLEEVQEKGEEPAEMEFMPLLEDAAINYLQGTPSVAAYGHIVSDKGRVAVDAEVKLEPTDNATDMMTLLMNVQSRLVVTVSPSFSEKVLDELVSAGQLPTSKNEFIQAITEGNRFILRNGEYSGKFEYKQGEVYSNGQLDEELLEVSRYALPDGVL